MESVEKVRESVEKVWRKCRESVEKVQRKCRESVWKVQRKCRESVEKVMVLLQFLAAVLQGAGGAGKAGRERGSQ